MEKKAEYLLSSLLDPYPCQSFSFLSTFFSHGAFSGRPHELMTRETCFYNLYSVGMILVMCLSSFS